ncbi:MAG: hypothetical protein V1867_03120 [Candidatus Falkowbacteria bacterium]
MSQTVTSRQNFILEALYNKNNDQTRIWGYDWNTNEGIEETEDGMTVIKLNTNRGEFEYE